MGSRRTFPEEIVPGLAGRGVPATLGPAHGSDGEGRFLCGLVHGMRCGIIAIDRRGGLKMMNRQAIQVLGLSRSPRCGAPIGRVLSDYPRLAQVLCESFGMTSLPNRAEMELQPEGPGGKTIGFTLSMIPGADGEPLGAAVFFKDLTQIEHKAEQERLKDRLAALGEMAASMAHEIRNPLASIEVSCSLLRRRLEGAGFVGEKNLELLGKITAEVLRLNRTITSSLEFVRPLSLNLEPAELPPILDQAITVARRRRGEPGIRIACNHRAPLPPFLMDRQQLRQVFENLILNAVEAVGDEGTVTVDVEVRDAPSASTIPYPMGDDRMGDPWHRFEQFAVIRVTDTGPGIREEERSRIFFPFYTTKKQGSGVGLAMAKKIVNSHRGLIDVDAAPGGGARFTVRLPMVLEPAEVRVR